MDEMPSLCPRCQSVTRSDVVKTAIWQGDRLFVVEDIQAQVCDNCFEQFYSEEVTDALRQLTENRFLTATINHEILVPVFSLKGIGAASPVPEPV
jgi:YgiT-type zinc finger domain-containing protein